MTVKEKEDLERGLIHELNILKNECLDCKPYYFDCLGCHIYLERATK